MVNLKERRKYQRRKVQDGAYAVVKDFLRNVGPINDISRGGLSFTLLEETNNQMEDFGDYFDIGIILAGEGYYLDRIPVKAVSDFQSTCKPSFLALPTRRLSVQFGSVSQKQMDIIDRFILHHTYI